MKQELLQVTESVVCTLELNLIETKERLEEKQQKVKELQSILRDRENEINFLREILSGKTDLIRHQQNTITSLHGKVSELNNKADPPVVMMKTYVPGVVGEPLSETAI